jgi:hypothetical protein
VFLDAILEKSVIPTLGSCNVDSLVKLTFKSDKVDSASPKWGMKTKSENMSVYEL